MDFQEKAKAIWAALDNMAEKNPESYRQFIHDQLHGDGAEEMWKQLGLNNPLDNARPGSTDSVESEKLKKRDGSKGQSKGSRIPSSRTRSVLTTSNASRLLGHSDRSGPPVESQEGPSSSQHALSTSLLDDSFSHSSLLINPLLARIIDDEEDQEPLLDLSLPTSAPNHNNGDGECKKGDSKPLIEEI